MNVDEGECSTVKRMSARSGRGVAWTAKLQRGTRMDVDCPTTSFTDSGTYGERQTARRHGETGGASASDDNYVVTMLRAGGLASEVLMHGEQQREQRARQQRLFERVALADFL
jgi:hypothetical protein